ncbi:hypothetical protein CCACVL1_17192 [Corchorus capsularis]|uniref:F-box domain-containing protein n=1 Tax=Corchorus capsularis TaxID=210143 RepID=A0A1R3HU25_COCAP|nr:hypothetical protein CCACVL1_17192 [Corchorus capsularis]
MALHKDDDHAGSRTDLHKRRRMIMERSFSWEELPCGVLELIFSKLGVIEFLLMACVCKSWRAIIIAMMEQFMAKQGPPLAFYMSPNARKYCYFYNLYENRLYRATLPHLSGNKCIGYTCGYLVLADSTIAQKKPDIWLVNPFTRHELQFPRPPRPYCNVILGALVDNPVSDFVAVAISKLNPFLQFIRSSDAKWTCLEFHELKVEDEWRIVDAAVFQGKIYLLSNNGQIGNLVLKSKITKKPMVELLDVKKIQFTFNSERRYCHIVTTPSELYVVEISRCCISFVMNRLDFKTKQWETVKLQGKILYFGKSSKSIALTIPKPFEIQKTQLLEGKGENWRILGDGIGHVARCFVGEGNVVECYEIVLSTPKHWKPDIFIAPPVWYFPHLAMTVDPVYG